jgi:hypothetical protein
MKNYFVLMMIAAVMASFSACDKDDDDPITPPDPPADTTYNVEYKFEVNENHGNVKLVYYGPSNDKKTVDNPTSPWEMSLTDFTKGDSIYFHLEIFPLANTFFDYSFAVNISDGDTPIPGGSGSNSFTVPDPIPPAVNPVHRSWVYLIE